MSSLKRRLSDDDARRLRSKISKDAKKTVKDIMAAIYYDINCICTFRAIIRASGQGDSANMDWYTYEMKCADALDLIRGVAAIMRTNSSPSKIHDRVGYRMKEMLSRVGWMIFAICAYSDAFRRACWMEVNQEIWDLLMDTISSNSRSIEVFARSRNLDWRGELLTFSGRSIPGLDEALGPANQLSDDHYHHYVQTSENTLRYPTFEGCVQTHMDHCTYDPMDWEEDNQPHPQTRQADDGDCNLCDKSECKCALASLAGNLVELVEYPNKGIGVRSLANFKKGDILDEYVGELHPREYDGDEVYSLELRVSQKTSTLPALISAKRHGNWTRFINHSCNPTTHFRRTIVGNTVMNVVQVERDISFGDEITVSYGARYWENQKCQCGEPNCISSDRYVDGEMDI